MLQSIVGKRELQNLAALASAAPGGNFAEVGVYKGGSANVLYKIARGNGQQRELHLFDTFEGMPFSDENLDKHKVGEFADINLDAIFKEMPKAILHVGVYPQTHDDSIGPLALIHCDCDQYKSYKAVIEHMYPLLVPGGILLFDDYPYLAGAKLAVEEHFSKAELLQAGNRFYVRKPLRAG